MSVGVGVKVLAPREATRACFFLFWILLLGKIQIPVHVLCPKIKVKQKQKRERKETTSKIKVMRGERKKGEAKNLNQDSLLPGGALVAKPVL